MKMVDEFYINYDTFSEAIFMNMLNQEDANFYIEAVETLKKDDIRFDEMDMNLCIEKIKELSLKTALKRL